ncbi:hypothetical protein JMUB6875_65560 [Nocardia sp. JMUB6875]|uniref:HEAT repeat domain-containing protein n=1 Tax=Nocardia sp. JMUB6875 TaxID=3158170 RepID=UPI0032E76A1E
MDDKGIRRIAARVYRGWLWDDGKPLIEYVERVAEGACAIPGAEGETVRWAALLSEARRTGVDDTELLRRGVPRPVVSLLAMSRRRDAELPVDHVERISGRRAAAAIRFAQLNEISGASNYSYFRDAHRLLAEKLGVPLPSIAAVEAAPVAAPAHPEGHWHDFAKYVAAKNDSALLSTLLTAYETESRACCREVIQWAIYAASDGPLAPDLAGRWWDSLDPWEAMIATRATSDADRRRSRLADERPEIVAAAIKGLSGRPAGRGEVAALGGIVRRPERAWFSPRIAAARRLREIGGPEAMAVLRTRVLSPIDPPWQEDPGWLADRGPAHIPALIAYLDESVWYSDMLYALVKLRATEAVPLICRKLREHPTWTQGISALGTLGSAEAIETLAAMAVTGGADARDHSLRALARISPAAAVDAALVAVDDIEPAVRDRAARILARHGDHRAVPALIRLCDTAFAASAAKALGRIGDPRAEPTLWKLFCTGSPRVRATAGRAMAGMPGPRRYLDYIAHSDPGVRRAYLRLLTHHRDWFPEHVIGASMRDPDPKVRATAAHQVATLECEALRPALDNLLDDPDPRVRRAAATAIRRPSGPDHHSRTDPSTVREWCSGARRPGVGRRR